MHSGCCCKMDASLAEIESARTGSRRELRLSGRDDQLAHRVAQLRRLPPSLGSLPLLTCLDISFLPTLNALPEEIGALAALRDLTVTHNAALAGLPHCIGSLRELRTLIASNNAIAALPPSLCILAKLQVLNVSANKLSALPENIGDLTELVTLDISGNQIIAFPESTWFLSRLATLDASRNDFESISAGIGGLSQLKSLSLRGCRRLRSLPGELSDCARLKDAAFDGCTAIEDRKLLRLVESSGANGTKQVLQHLRGGKSKRQVKDAEHEHEEKEAAAAISQGKPVLRVEATSAQTSHNSRSITVITTDSVKKVRPHIVCCILSGLDLRGELEHGGMENNEAAASDVDKARQDGQPGSRFRRFISLQTALHDRECDRRNLAAVGTHDLSRIAGDSVHYVAEAPGDIRLLPLKADAELTASDFVLRAAAADDPFGIGRHLHLLEGLGSYPVLRDSAGVICFPPIVNSHRTRVDEDTTDVFLEVSSRKDLVTCRRVMDALVTEIVTSVGRRVGEPAVVLRQVRVVDAAGNLRVAYPSKQDLVGRELKVEWAR